MDIGIGKSNEVEKCVKDGNVLSCQSKKSGEMCRFDLAANDKGQIEVLASEGGSRCLQKAIPEKMKQIKVGGADENAIF